MYYFVDVFVHHSVNTFKRHPKTHLFRSSCSRAEVLF